MCPYLEDNDLNKEQQALFRSLTPGYLSAHELKYHLDYLTRNGEESTLHRFNKRTIFSTQQYRADILSHVDILLSKYQSSPDLITTLSEPILAERALLWAALQLYAQLQAIDEDLGACHEPMTEYKKCSELLLRCAELLKRLSSQYSAQVEQLSQVTLSRPKDDIAYDLGWETWFKSVVQFADEKNNTRLFWVWGKATEDLGFEYVGATEARERLSESSTIPGIISWSLYFVRGSYFFYHYMQKRRAIPLWLQNASLPHVLQQQYLEQYYRGYWDLYKYRILNDYVWGPINLFSCYWWVGDDIYGWFGDFSTCFLLCMDIYLTELGAEEAAQAYYDISTRHEQSLASCTARIVDALAQLSDKSEVHNIEGLSTDTLQSLLVLEAALCKKSLYSHNLSKDEVALYVMLQDLRDLYDAKEAYNLRWQNKVAVMNYERMYTWGLLIAFVMCVSLLMPLTLGVTLAMSLKASGTILCMALTIAYRTVKAMMQIGQDEAVIRRLEQNKENLYTEFQCLKQAVTPQNAAMKYRLQELYQALMSLEQQIQHDNASIRYQYLELARTSLMRILVPSLIALTLMFGPASILMIPAYVYALFLSGLLAYGLDKGAKCFKPQDPLPLSLDKTAFYRFYQSPKANRLISTVEIDADFSSLDALQFQFTPSEIR